MKTVCILLVLIAYDCIYFIHKMTVIKG